MRPPPERTETEAWTSLPPHSGGGQAVVDVEGDGAARAERDAGLVGLVHLELEADAAAGELAGDAGTRAGEQALAVEVVDVERDGRPAGRGVRVRQHVEHGRGMGRCGGGGRPCPHDGNGPRARARPSSASQTIFRRPSDDPPSSSGMTRDGQPGRRRRARTRVRSRYAVAASDPRARPEPRPGAHRRADRGGVLRRGAARGAAALPRRALRLARRAGDVPDRRRPRRAPPPAARLARARDRRLRALPAARPRDQRQRLRAVLRRAVRAVLLRAARDARPPADSPGSRSCSPRTCWR